MTVEQLLDLNAVDEILETKSLIPIKRIVEMQMSMKDVKQKDFVNSIAALDIVKTVQDHTGMLIYKLFAG